MKKVLIISAVLFGLLLVVLVLFVRHYQAEKYQIVHTAFLTTTNEVLREPAALCYSNKDLMQAVRSPEVLDLADIKRFNLDATNLIVCVVSNYVVEKVVGRQDFGLILLRKSATNGVSFTVLKGTKRFLQFHYPDK